VGAKPRPLFRDWMVADEGRDEDGLSSTAREMRRAQPYLAAVWKLVGGAAVGVIGGLLLDRWTGWTPWALVGLSVLGICAGFYGFIHDVLKLEKR
jgi:ATP synthase protein I